MGLIEKRSIKKNLTLGILLIIVLVAVFVLLQKYFSNSQQTTGNTNISADPVTRLPVVKNLGEDLFNDNQFNSLEQFGTLPVEPGKTGRSNPFITPRF